MQKNLFVVTSAISTGIGPFEADARLEQTIQTLASIKEKDTDADIIILELSRTKIQPDAELALQRFAPTHIFHFHENTFIQSYHENHANLDDLNTAKIKNHNELHALASFFHWAKQNLLQEKYKRIFKISGRYCLNENFKIQLHESQNNKCVFIKRNCYFENDNFSRLMDESYMTRLCVKSRLFINTLLEQFRLFHLPVFQRLNR